MSVPFKPDNHSTVSPYLIVDGAADTIDFLKKVFDAREICRFPDGHGRMLHAEVLIDDTVIMLTDGPAGGNPVPAHVYIYVEDVDATYKQALTAGATSIQEPIKKDDYDRRGGIRDAGGTTWWIATNMPD